MDENVLLGGVCWGVTDNIKYLLAIDPNNIPIIKVSNDIPLVLSIISDSLYDNKLLVIEYQKFDEESDCTHYFALIGDHGWVHKIEFLGENGTHTIMETYGIETMFKIIYDLMTGFLADWFNHEKGEFFLTISVHDRKPLTVLTINEFLKLHNRTIFPE
jgi:hypothetical protein